MRSILFSIFLLFVAPIAADENTPVTDNNDGSSILIVGDSLSAAYGMQQSDAWPSLLQNRLQEHGYDHQVFNSSISGDTTQGGLSRLPSLIESRQPDIIIIELGGNDGLRGISNQITRRNLEQMIQLGQAADAQVLLTSIQLPPNYGSVFIERFRSMFTELSESYQIPLIPFLLKDVALNPELMLDDGIHPTAEAQPMVLDVVWTVLQPLLNID